MGFICNHFLWEYVVAIGEFDKLDCEVVCWF